MDKFPNFPGVGSNVDKEKLAETIKTALDSKKTLLDEVQEKHKKLEYKLSEAYKTVSGKVKSSCSEYIDWFEKNGKSLKEEDIAQDNELRNKLEQLEECVAKYDNGISKKLRPFDSQFESIQEKGGKCNLECVKNFSLAASTKDSVDCFANCFESLANDSSRLYDVIIDRI
jgi:hypothetical protein